MTMSLPRMLFFSLTGNDLGFRRALAAVEARADRRDPARRREQPGEAILDELIAAGSSDDELRDQLVTLLAAGHETTAGALAWALERLARHPRGARAAARRASRATPTPSSRRCCARGRCSRSPRASSSRRSRSAAGSCPPACTSRPASTSRTAAPTLYADPTAFRPERFLGDDAPDGYAWIPFGGGVRRCVGAAFAAMEMTEVLRAVAARVSLRPDRPRRRAHAPALAHADPGAPRARDRRAATFKLTASAALLPPQPPDRELPDLLARARRRARRGRAAARRATRTRTRGSSTRRAPGVVTKRVARAADDGYRNALVPGLRATADAERLASALAWADARLEFPGPHPAVAEEPVQEEAFWLAFLLALVPPGAHELHEAIVASRPSWAARRAARGPRRRPAHDPRLPGVGRAHRHAGRGLPRRAGLDAGAALRPHLRAARAARARSRRPLRAAQHARRGGVGRGRRRRPPPRQERRRDHARRQARARLRRRDAARAPGRRPRRRDRRPPRRARPRARGVGRRRGARGEAPPAIRAALGLA